MKHSLYNLSVRLHSLSVFRSLLSDPVLQCLLEYLDCVEEASASKAAALYAAFAARLYDTHTVNLSRYIQNIVNDNENVFIRSIGSGQKPSSFLEESLCEDLKVLQEVAEFTPAKLRTGFAWDGFLPGWETDNINLTESYRHRIENIGKYGYGIYARYHMFYINQNTQIVPVRHPDTTRLSDLIDYTREKAIILENTKALLAGKPAANILLTGDAGTGKSSTVKAVVNELYGEGLRILEVRKEQLHEIPSVLDELTENPLKFILFIDDLSFARDDDNFSALKAILEGSVSAKSQNVVIYATSNRRHLVKEKFSDREGDDVHFNDTMQEIVSLSERFGIQITFQRPDKSTYLDIVRHLAETRGIRYDAEKLNAAAERFVLMRSTRSARAAKQFVDSLIAGSAEDIL